MSDYGTDYIENEIERETVRWYREFTEYWSVRVPVDTDDIVADAEYAVRVVGPNGEAARNTGIAPADVPDEVRDCFEDIYRDAIGVV